MKNYKTTKISKLLIIGILTVLIVLVSIAATSYHKNCADDKSNYDDGRKLRIGGGLTRYEVWNSTNEPDCNEFECIDEEETSNSTRVRNLGLCGGDGRAQVSDTTVTPYRSIGLLQMYFWDSNNNRYIRRYCTGFLITNTRLATAAHCLYDRGLRRRAHSISVVFGPTSPPNENYCYTSYSYGYPGGWRRTGNNVYDFGFVDVHSTPRNTRPIPTTAKPLPFFGRGGGGRAKICGYPGTGFNSYACQRVDAGQYCDTDVAGLSAGTFILRSDVTAGQSGSPVFLTQGIGAPSRNWATSFGIVTADLGGCPTIGVKFRQQMLDWLKGT